MRQILRPEMMIALGVFLVVIFSFFGPGFAATRFPPNAHGVRVIDGDTIETRTGQVCRLWGIDAPEWKQLGVDPRRRTFRAGVEAAEHLREIIGPHPVETVTVSRDRWGRDVCIVYVLGDEINGRMVADGFAFDEPRYSKRRYSAMQKYAQMARKGIFRGTVQFPPDWRRENGRPANN